MEGRAVLIDAIGYNEKRNIVDLPHENFKIKKRLNLFRLPNAFYFKRYNRSQPFFLNSHYEPFQQQNIHHFYNTISFGKGPWITTFETLLPRWGKVPAWLEKKGVELMAGKNCKKLIAISECTRVIQEDYLRKFPDLKEVILAKTVVIHPPQKPLIKLYEEKEFDNNFIVFTIVGADFFIKGGKEVLQVFENLIKKGYPLKLNIISSLQYGDYATKTSLIDQENALKIIQKYPGRINLFSQLPNSEVLQLLKNSHVGLLPTYADTYGYSVLEAQASGCPVISTNVRALPEINNNEHGWVIEVPKDAKGNALLNTEDERQFFSSLVEEKLTRIITDICENPSEITKKGISSLQFIKNVHDPKLNAKIIADIYQEVV